MQTPKVIADHVPVLVTEGAKRQLVGHGGELVVERVLAGHQLHRILQPMRVWPQPARPVVAYLAGVEHIHRVDETLPIGSELSEVEA